MNTRRNNVPAGVQCIGYKSLIQQIKSKSSLSRRTILFRSLVISIFPGLGPLVKMYRMWAIILGRHHLRCCLVNFTMEQSQVERIVDAAITKNNESLLDSMKEILNSSLSDIKRANTDTADWHLREIKKLKFKEPCQFKKKANEDQYRFNSKLTDVLGKAKSLCPAQNLDKVKESLHKGENLLAERQKHILLVR